MYDDDVSDVNETCCTDDNGCLRAAESVVWNNFNHLRLSVNQ